MNKEKKRNKGKWIVNLVLAVICFMWLIPTLGLFISSFRPAEELLQSGWWTVFPHKEWTSVNQIQLPKDTDLSKPISVKGLTFTSRQLTNGVTVNGQHLIWKNRRARTLSVQDRKWKMNDKLTLKNYKTVLGGRNYEIKMPGGSTTTVKGENLTRSFLNTLTVAVPATVIPILIATFAAYAFAWMRFPGRRIMFVTIIMLLVVPLQLALIPILQDYTKLGLNGSYLGIWIAHTGFGLPLTIYFMFNSISRLPKDLFESAFIDGASNFTIFTRLILPLSVPMLASISIFQFLWVWNDYLVALVFIGGQPDVQVLSMRIANMIGSRGSDWHLLTAAAFISMVMPLTVFFSLQRFFVRGLMGGSVKG